MSAVTSRTVRAGRPLTPRRTAIINERGATLAPTVSAGNGGRLRPGGRISLNEPSFEHGTRRQCGEIRSAVGWWPAAYDAKSRRATSVKWGMTRSGPRGGTAMHTQRGDRPHVNPHSGAMAERLGAPGTHLPGLCPAKDTPKFFPPQGSETCARSYDFVWELSVHPTCSQQAGLGGAGCRRLFNTVPHHSTARLAASHLVCAGSLLGGALDRGPAHSDRVVPPGVRRRQTQWLVHGSFKSVPHTCFSCRWPCAF